jgi:hypothetical protein
MRGLAHCLRVVVAPAKESGLKVALLDCSVHSQGNFPQSFEMTSPKIISPRVKDYRAHLRSHVRISFYPSTDSYMLLDSSQSSGAYCEGRTLGYGALLMATGPWLRGPLVTTRPTGD